MRPDRGSRFPDWSELALPLPKKTADRILAIGKRPTDADNVGLWLDKLVHRRKSDWKLEKGYRTFSLGQLCKPWCSALGKEASQRMDDAVVALHPKPKQLCRLRAKLDGRLMVGHGRSAATETSVTFHPIWGVPVIPGSALKGVARAELTLGGASEAEIEAVFGGEERAGRVIFYDAIPAEGAFALALDVLTPHHRDYYEGKGPPADWDSPEPFTFITVVDTTFDVWLGAASSKQADLDALGRAEEALKQALEESGVGGKTAAGYGRFKVTRR